MSPAAGGRDHDGSGRVRIPADVERPDTLLAGLTARQLAILAVAALALWAGYAATRHLVAPALYGAAALPFGALAAFLALGRVEGVGTDRWAWMALAHRKSSRRLVPAPGGIPAVPGVVAEAARAGGARLPASPAPLRLPLSGIRNDGVVELGAEGLAVICKANAVTFALRTPAEQEALVAGFARFCHSLAAPVQVLVRAEPLDLAPAIDSLLDAAPGLPHVALERAARDHAGFLAELAASRVLLRREVLVVLRQPPGRASAEGAGAGRLRRRAAEAVSALAAAGVNLSVLDSEAAAGAIGRCLDPASPTRPGALGGSPAGTYEPVTLADDHSRFAPPNHPGQQGTIR
ncbi:MAG: PrgI family protein [Actinomycetota bacterium]|nr:PrgI family protein [Actinomycetota bacterium]